MAGAQAASPSGVNSPPKCPDCSVIIMQEMDTTKCMACLWSNHTDCIIRSRADKSVLRESTSGGATCNAWPTIFIKILSILQCCYECERNIDRHRREFAPPLRVCRYKGWWPECCWLRIEANSIDTAALLPRLGSARWIYRSLWTCLTL